MDKLERLLSFFRLKNRKNISIKKSQLGGKKRPQLNLSIIFFIGEGSKETFVSEKIKVFFQHLPVDQFLSFLSKFVIVLFPLSSSFPLSLSLSMCLPLCVPLYLFVSLSLSFSSQSLLSLSFTLYLSLTIFSSIYFFL